MTRGRLIAGVCVVLGLALAAAFAFIGVNQTQIDAAEHRARLNQQRIAALQLELGQALTALAQGRADDMRLRRLVQALQHQVRQLGGTPVGPAQTSAGDGRTGAGTASPTPSGPAAPTPRPSPTRSPTPPRHSPSPTPSPTPSRICVLVVCV